MTRFYHNSVPQHRSFSEKLLRIISLTIFTGILFLAPSCEEDATIIGEKLLPGSDFVSIISTDTISVKSFTVYTDSIRSDNPAYSYLGQLYNPYFGTTSAEFVTQLRLNSTWQEDVFTIDSVKLYISFRDVRGNLQAGHIMRLTEIDEEIYVDSVYYSNKQVSLTGFAIDIPLPELQADTINDLVLDLPVEFGTHITRNTEMFFHDNAIPDFRSYFKGLYFQLIPAGDPAFITLSVYPSSTYGLYSNYIVLFMHDENESKKEFALILDSYTRNAAFNKYTHDYTTGVPGKKIEHINDGYFDTLTYLQGLNGVYTKILLPGLDSIKNNPAFNGISVNKARLVYPYMDIEAAGSLPAQLLMRYTDNSGVRNYVHDYATGSSFYNGSPDTVAGVYNFNLGTFVQIFLDDTENKIKPELDLYIHPSSTLQAIMGANGNSKPVKFEFTYTKF